MALCACFLDEEAKAQMRLNRAIERDLVQWKKDNSKEFKLLLLGGLVIVAFAGSDLVYFV